MSKKDEAKEILQALEVPTAQCKDICCLVLVVMAGIREQDSWRSATNEYLRIHDIIESIKDNYGVYYAENTRETIRKQAIQSV